MEFLSASPNLQLLVSFFTAIILAGAAVWLFLSKISKPTTSDQTSTMAAIGMAWNDRLAMQGIAEAVAALADEAKDATRVTETTAENLKDLARSIDRLARSVEEATSAIRRNH